MNWLVEVPYSIPCCHGKLMQVC